MKQEILGMLSQPQFLYLIFDKDDNINKQQITKFMNENMDKVV